MKRLKVGINGFGRIGRVFTRIALNRDLFDIVAINTRKTPNDMLAYLLQHDSTYRTFEKKVTAEKNGISVDGKSIISTQFEQPAQIPWDKYNIDIVVDATGAFKTVSDLSPHIKGSVKKVILTAPAKDESMCHIVMGVNDDILILQNESVISNASCTTNCASPLFKVLHENFTVLTGFLTTTHAYTQSQSLQDDAGKTIERSRAAALNIIPSTTGAAKAIIWTIPELKGRIDGMAIRVPVSTGSFSDITVVVQKPTTKEEVNQVFLKASGEARFKGILKYETEKLVSSDYIGSSFSSIFDSNYTKVINHHLVKVFAWYDNEWGYSARLVDLIVKLSTIN